MSVFVKGDLVRLREGVYYLGEGSDFWGIGIVAELANDRGDVKVLWLRHKHYGMAHYPYIKRAIIPEQDTPDA